MSQFASIEVEFVEGEGRGSIRAAKIIRIRGKVEGYLEGLTAGDVVFIGRGRGWILKKAARGRFFLVPDRGSEEPDRGSEEVGTQGIAWVGVAGIMRKMA